MFTGFIALAVRLGLYGVFGWLSLNGAGTLLETQYCWTASNSCIDVDALSQIAAGVIGYAGTIIWSRIAKKKPGGVT